MGLTRREFVLGLAGAGAVTALGACRGGGERQADRPAPTTGAAAGGAGLGSGDGDGRLVVLTLYGGNDGLDTVVPAAASAYQSARGALARRPDEVLDLGDGLGLHPALGRLKGRWDDDSLAIVRGVGFGDLDRSHFHCMDVWQAGGDGHATSGWLGRWLDAGRHDPLRALAVGTDLPLLLRGERRSGSLVPIGPLTVPGGSRLATLFGEMSRPGTGRPALGGAAAAAGADVLAVADAVGRATAGTAADDDPVDGGGGAKAGGDAGGQEEKGKPKRGYGGLGAQLDLVAKLIEADLPTRVYAVSMGGFDTHSNERGTHDRLMADLDAALGTFLDRMGDRPVTVLAYSEFGRRVEANASGGTDHGAAGPAFVCGPRVKGGFYGEEPSLTDLADGDLRYNVDFRRLYSTVLNGVLGVDPDIALPDAKRHPPLPLLMA